MPPAQLSFVSIDPSKSLKPGKDVAIRSRVMQGVNKREGSRRSQREKRREEASKTNQVAVCNGSPQVMPGIPGSAVVRFACQIDSEAQGLLFQTYSYNIANQTLTPLDICVNFDGMESAPFQWLQTDSAFLHATLTGCYADQDFRVPTADGKPGMKVVAHMRETLALLSKKMDEAGAHEDEAVMYVILNLVLLSAAYGDWKASAAHFDGIRKIVEMRGGLDFLRTRPKLHFKLDRLDLAWSMSTNRRAFFADPAISWSRILEYPQIPPSMYQVPRTWPRYFRYVFQDFQRLTMIINDNVRNGVRWDAVLFQSVLSSIQNRLLHLHAQLTDPMEELTRLTMLAFLTTKFKLPGIQIPYTWLVDEIPKVYAHVDLFVLEREQVLVMWCLMVAGISVIGVDEGWLKEAWVEADFRYGWAETSAMLKSVMWVDCIHDAKGLDAFSKFNTVPLDEL